MSGVGKIKVKIDGKFKLDLKARTLFKPRYRSHGNIRSRFKKIQKQNLKTIKLTIHNSFHVPNDQRKVQYSSSRLQDLNFMIWCLATFHLAFSP